METPHHPEPSPAEKNRGPKPDAEPAKPERGPEGGDQHDTAEPQPGEGTYQGGGIEDAIGGGQSGQGGG